MRRPYHTAVPQTDHYTDRQTGRKGATLIGGPFPLTVHKTTTCSPAWSREMSPNLDGGEKRSSHVERYVEPSARRHS